MSGFKFDKRALERVADDALRPEPLRCSERSMRSTGHTQASQWQRSNRRCGQRAAARR